MVDDQIFIGKNNSYGLLMIIANSDGEKFKNDSKLFYIWLQFRLFQLKLKYKPLSLIYISENR
jgi:hypothetical protein